MDLHSFPGDLDTNNNHDHYPNPNFIQTLTIKFYNLCYGDFLSP